MRFAIVCYGGPWPLGDTFFCWRDSEWSVSQPLTDDSWTLTLQDANTFPLCKARTILHGIARSLPRLSIALVPIV